ncbi:MAG TPA: efflux RND transporter periplasmic adaptor subunit [Candidatus Krumholzibacteria bacterium]|nr:efflux RND transporter periplasmic adaptor subunit [Candidatus Krumholzibacteria bacterium]
MKKRMIIMLTSLTVFVAAIGLVKFMQIRAAIAQGASFQMPPEAVTTIVADQDEWQASLGAIGTVAAVRGVMVSADLPGVVASLTFESGKRVRAGDVLVTLDAKQEQAQLAAAEAQRELSRANLERVRELRAKGVTSQAEYDRVDAEAKAADARAAEIRAVIERKTIRAPFTGSLGIRQVNLGQYLEGGAPVVPLQALDPVYVNFSVPQQSLDDLRVGAEVRVEAEGLPGVASSGRITAVNSVIDEATRNVQVQATLANPDGKLLPGMFVQVRLMMEESSAVVALPASSISYAPYGDSVFIVEDVKGPDGKPYLGVRQQFVKLGPARGDQVAILEGVQPGEQVVTSGVFKLRSGAAVQVHNEIQPSNDPAPKPEDS